MFKLELQFCVNPCQSDCYMSFWQIKMDKPWFDGRNCSKSSGLPKYSTQTLNFLHIPSTKQRPVINAVNRTHRQCNVSFSSRARLFAWSVLTVRLTSVELQHSFQWFGHCYFCLLLAKVTVFQTHPCFYPRGQQWHQTLGEKQSFHSMFAKHCFKTREDELIWILCCFFSLLLLIPSPVTFIT